MLTSEQIQQYRSQYNISIPDVVETPQKGGLFQSLGGIAKETAGRIAGIEASDMPRPKKAVVGLGELAKGITRAGVKTISAGVSAVIPDKVEQEAKQSALTLLQTPTGQRVLKAIQTGGEYYQDARKTNPEAFQLIESVLNISSVYPLAKGAQTVAKTAGELGGVAKTGIIGTVGATKKATEGAKLFISGKGITGSIDDVVRQAEKGLSTERTLGQIKEVSAQPSLFQKWAGISPDIKNRIAGKSEKLKTYFNIAHARNQSDLLQTPLEYGAKNVNNAVTKMEGVLNNTGSKIGSFRRKVGTYQANVDQVNNIEKSFVNELSKLNLEIRNGAVIQRAGTVTRIGSKNDIKVLQELYNDFRTVKQNPNLEKLIDLRNLFDRKINFEKSAREISSAIDPLSRNVRGSIAATGANIVGKSEALNLKKYSEFIDAYNELKSFTDRKAGAEFLLKQVLSERGRSPRETMAAIKEYTGVDLMDDAVMSSIATDLIGNSRQKGLFRQEITKAGLDASAVLKGDTKGAVDLMFNFLKKRLNEEKQFLKAAK